MKLRAAFVAAIALFGTGMAAAQDWPSRTVRLIVPYPPGGNADVVGRIAAHALQAELGQAFVIENKAGAGGLIGGEAVAKSAPDGYTFLLSANGPVLYAPELAEHKPYDWRKDFVPVGTISLTSLALLVHPGLAAKTLPEFIDLARHEGEKLVFAAGGMGTSNHLFSELIQSQLNLKWTTAQYRGTAPAMADLLGGHVQFSIDQISASLALIRDGRVRALAVSGAKRVSSLPDVPTFVEQGYKNLVGYTFVAILAPAGTPSGIVERLSAALKKIVRDPPVRDQIAALGAEPEAMSPEEFRAYLENEDAVWLPVVRSAAKPQ
ncbi:MAG TPA: tripartite tricarboxylate transporter substrate binding protein [Xanthobacteraceae bacterium]